MATTNDKQVIFSLVNVGKVYPPKRQVLREIYLGFYYGAKIGVLGLNGSGKSSLLRIIAGVDQNYTGEITRSKGYSVGLLEQEPQLDPDKTVKEIVEEGKKELVAMLREYDEVSNKMGEATPDELEKLLEKQAQLQEKIEAANGWELENVLELHGRAALPTAGCEGRGALRRREATSGPLPPHDPGAGYIIARRADEPSRCRVRAMA